MYHHHALYPRSPRQLNLERVTFRLTRDRRYKGETKCGVKRRCRQNQGRTSLHLLVPGLRIEIQDKEVSALGDSHSVSRPTLGPKPTSASRSLTVASRSASRDRAGRSKAMPLEMRRKLISSPSRRSSSRAMAAGSRTVRLLPYFAIFAFMCIRKYTPRR